jgi:hypothetical protein
MLKAFLAAALMAGSACAATSPTVAQRGEADLAKAISGRVAGEPVRCLPLRGNDSAEVYGGTAIVYRGIGNTLFVNRPDGANMLHRDDIPVQRVFGSQVCRGDQVRLLDRLTRYPRGFVRLTEFVPYRKVEPPSN